MPKNWAKTTKTMMSALNEKLAASVDESELSVLEHFVRRTSDDIKSMSGSTVKIKLQCTRQGFQSL